MVEMLGLGLASEDVGWGHSGARGRVLHQRSSSSSEKGRPR